jgi:hypothetical protein
MNIYELERNKRLATIIDNLDGFEEKAPIPDDGIRGYFYELERDYGWDYSMMRAHWPLLWELNNIEEFWN